MYDQTQAAIHDGERVRARLAESGISPVDFNSRMQWGEKRIYKMLKKAHWETGELLEAGKILEYNFFLAYAQGYVSQIIDTIRIPIGALRDPKAFKNLRAEIISLADEFRKHDDQEAETPS